eukprot:TRINITY_DN10885_c0_g1_i1.p1 TRINITY_DN10885_c0_g1~~TRINITY_DN10885_c0_g1_i1.p1  ORF type:complete len:279 (+),score=2.06 TRINITY_DN10885_c0_g1_i1:73-909(+)
MHRAQEQLDEFFCEVCGFYSVYDYHGRNPPYQQQEVFFEDAYLLRDPYVTEAPRPICLGGTCSICNKCVCVSAKCSVFYTKRFCLPCVRKNASEFPAEVTKEALSAPDRLPPPRPPARGRAINDDIVQAMEQSAVPALSAEEERRLHDSDKHFFYNQFMHDQRPGSGRKEDRSRADHRRERSPHQRDGLDQRKARQREGDAVRDRDRQRDDDRDRRDSSRQRDSDRDRYRHTDRDRDRDRDRQRHSDKDRDRHYDRDRQRHRERGDTGRVTDERNHRD